MLLPMLRATSVGYLALSLLLQTRLASAQAEPPPASPAPTGATAPGGAPPPPSMAPAPTTTPTEAAAVPEGASGDPPGGFEEPQAVEQPRFEPSAYDEPPLPPEPKPAKSTFPDISLRVDPLNWLLEGRLGLELEFAPIDVVSIELVPVFVTSEQPPLLHLANLPDTLYQESNGVGSLSGASLGVGFWLDGKAFRGSVLRAFFTNYAFHYESRENGVVVDQVDHTERRVGGMFGSHSRWGAFTLATALGLGVELNRHRRCESASGEMVTEGCPDDQLLIRVNQAGDTAGLYSFLHPAYLFFRLSLGVVF